MKKNKYLYLVFIAVAIFSWHFVEIKPHASSISIKVPNRIYASAQSPRKTVGYPGFLTSVLNGTQPLGTTGWLDSLYNFSRGLLNLSLFLFLVYIAFRNILNANIETYAIKKLLPKIVFAAFLGNLLRPIIAIGSRVVDYIIGNVSIFHTPTAWSWAGEIRASGFTVVKNIPDLDLGVGGWIIAVITMGFAALWAVANSYLIALAILIVNFLLITGMLVIGFFHSLSPWIVLFATAFGPIAIGLYILPETEGIFKKWLKIISFWLIFPIILNAVHFLITIIPEIEAAEGDGIISNFIQILFPLLLKIGLFTLAVRIPFTWEKDVGGVIASLPQTAAGTWSKARGTVEKGLQSGGRVVMQGREWESKLESKVRKKAEADAKPGAETNARRRYNNRASRGSLGNQEDVAKVLSIESAGYLEEAKKTPSLFEPNMSKQKMDAAYEKYRNGTLGNAAQEAFFLNNERSVKAKSKDAFIMSETKDSAVKAGTDEVIKMKTYKGSGRDQLAFRAVRGMQKWTAANLPANYAQKEEVYQAELKKSGFRFDYLGAKVAGPVADTKSQTDRKDDDFSRLKSTEKVIGQMDYTIKRMVAAYKAEMEKISGQPFSEEMARELVMAEFDRLDDAAESTYVYNSMFLGMEGELKDDQGNIIQQVKIDTNDLGTMIAGHNRLRDLSAQEARSTRPIEEQLFLRNQKMSQAYALTAGSSSAIAQPTNEVGDLPGAYNNNNRDFIPLGTRQINDNLERINETISQANGTNALEMLNDTFKDIDLKDVKNEDYNRFAGDNEGIVREIGRLVARRTDQPTADNFVNQLKLSHGLSTGEMMRQAGRFADPKVSKMVLDYNKRQKMEMVILSKSEEARTLEGQANQFVAKASANPKVVGQIKEALKVYLDATLNNDKTIPPNQVYAAKQFLAAQVGIAGNLLKPAMVSSLAQTMQVVTVRQPTPLAEPSTPPRNLPGRRS
ncbi:MAG: hypothetical protein ABH810_00670 [bacterium]